MTQTFEFHSVLPTSCEEAFRYHARPGALQRLIPPWESVSVIKSNGSIETDSEVLLRLKLFPGISKDWLARHEAFHPPRQFSDRQVYGPFASWKHDHCFEPISSEQCRLTDRVTYEIPFGSIGSLLGSSHVKRQLRRMFAYRHQITKEDLELGSRLTEIEKQKRPDGNRSHPSRRIAISGSSGLIGRRIVALLTVLGHHVILLKRPSSKDRFAIGNHSTTVTSWSPEKGLANPKELDGVDAVIHLAGRSIASGRWTDKVKKELWKSRVDATAVLCEQLSALEKPPSAFVSASGIGFYGSRGNECITENSIPSDDFLGRLASAWEDASVVLDERGVRRAVGRLAIVLDPLEGALAKLLPVFRWGGGGRLGSGDQYWSWITADDAASAFIWLALNPHCSGPFNFSASSEPMSGWVSKLSKVLNRPALLPVPAFALQLAMGEMADALLLSSANAANDKLREAGYVFRTTDLSQAFHSLLGQ